MKFNVVIAMVVGGMFFGDVVITRKENERRKAVVSNYLAQDESIMAESVIFEFESNATSAQVTEITAPKRVSYLLGKVLTEKATSEEVAKLEQELKDHGAAYVKVQKGEFSALMEINSFNVKICREQGYKECLRLIEEAHKNPGASRPFPERPHTSVKDSSAVPAQESESRELRR